MNTIQLSKIRVTGLDLAVHDEGSGDLCLVFVHYWGGSSRTWAPVIANLRSLYRCVSYDQRGWGESDDASEGYTVASLANDTLQLIRALNVQRYVLVGHSMGGKIVQYLAAQHPEGLRAAALVAPAPPNPQILPPQAHEQQKHAYDSADNVKQAISFLSERPLAEEMKEQIITDSLRGSAAAEYAWPNETQQEDISDMVGSISTPTLVIAGLSDRERPFAAQQAEVISHIPGVQTATISGAGHLLPLEAPLEVADAIRIFLEQRAHELK